MSIKEEERWITFCHSSKIKVKRYPNCFSTKKKKKVKSKKKQIEEHTTSTLCSGDSSDCEDLFHIDTNLSNCNKINSKVEPSNKINEPPTVIFDLVPNYLYLDLSPDSLKDNEMNVSSTLECELDKCEHDQFNVLSVHDHQSTNLVSSEQSDFSADGIKVTSSHPIPHNIIKCECGKKFKSSNTLRLHKTRECCISCSPDSLE